MIPPRVLVVEDEQDIAGLIKHTLERSGDASVEVVGRGDEAIRSIAGRPPDLIILDLNLPVLSGEEVCRVLRQRAETNQIPIIMLTARTSESDRVAGLDLGADDYVTKPFSMDELLARLRATSRRAAPPDEPVVAQVGTVRIDLGMTTAADDTGKPVHLTPNEWKLLGVLLRRPGKLVSNDTLLTAVRGSAEHTDPSYLRIYFAQLRRKLEPEPSRPRYLITEPGMGYRYRP